MAASGKSNACSFAAEPMFRLARHFGSARLNASRRDPRNFLTQGFKGNIGQCAPGVEHDAPAPWKKVLFEPHGFTQPAANAIANDCLANGSWSSKTKVRTVARFSNE